jgi:hypothetical protein
MASLGGNANKLLIISFIMSDQSCKAAKAAEIPLSHPIYFGWNYRALLCHR